MSSETATVAERLPISGWPGYEIDTNGNVWSINWSGRSSGPPGQWNRMRGTTNSTGRVVVGLSRNGRQKLFLVHRLVLEIFVGPCPPGMECCHGDGDPTNNKLSNLRWDTSKSNKADMKRHGRQRAGSSVFGSKLQREDVLSIRALARNGQTIKELAVKFGVAAQTISKILLRQTWRHI